MKITVYAFLLFSLGCSIKNNKASKQYPPKEAMVVEISKQQFDSITNYYFGKFSKRDTILEVKELYEICRVSNTLWYAFWYELHFKDSTSGLIDSNYYNKLWFCFGNGMGKVLCNKFEGYYWDNSLYFPKYKASILNINVDNEVALSYRISDLKDFQNIFLLDVEKLLQSEK